MPLTRATSTQIRPTAEGTKSPTFSFSAKDVSATAVEVGGQMVVLAGSDARAEEQPSLATNVKTLREQLRRSGKLVPTETREILRFTEDVAFTPPSAAAQAVMGTSRNGRRDGLCKRPGKRTPTGRKTKSLLHKKRTAVRARAQCPNHCCISGAMGPLVGQPLLTSLNFRIHVLIACVGFLPR